MATGAQDDEQLDPNRRTFSAFLGWLKWGIIVVALLLIGMAIFLGPR